MSDHRIRSRSWSIALVVVAGAIGLLVLRPATEVTEARISPPAAPVVQRVEPVAPAVAAQLALPNPVSRRASLMQDLNASTNHRDFIAIAKKNLDRGGGAYAMWAMQECDGIRFMLKSLRSNPRPPATDSRDIVARAEAMTMLEARCGVLMEQETDALGYWRQIKADGSRDADPLLGLQTQLYDPSYKTDPDARRRLVVAILDAQDPLLWERYASQLVQVDWKTRHAFFDGATYDVDAEPALLLAIGLVICGLGRECDATHDLYVAQVCVQITVCEHDRFALARLQAEAQGFPFEKVMAYYDRMLGAFRDRRVDAFVQS